MRSDLLEGLNESQIAAVTHIDGPMLVLAGPGSGKTRVVTQRVAYLIDQGVDPRNMLALTFTNKAAQEMRSRVERLVGPNNVWMGTFHGFCVRLLRRYARLVGLPENFSIYDVDDSHAALKNAIQASRFELTHTSLSTLSNRISYYKNRLVTPEILESEALSSEEHSVGQVYPYYQRELLQNGAVDFDDILMHTAVLLRSNPELRREWDEQLRYVMVDEYQDTNLAQYVIVRQLCVDQPNLAATGDPDQSIYGWRGASTKNVTHLERDFSDLRVVRLEQNYRSTPEILSAADYLIQHNEYRKSKKLVPLRNGGQTIRLVIYPTARNEAEEIADQIVALSDHGSDFSEFGVLYRTNAQSRLFEQAMLRRQIPFQLIGGFRFYMRKEIKDLVAYLLLVNNPDDNVALGRAINSPPRGIGKQTLAKIEAHASKERISMLEACRQSAEAGILSKRATGAVRGFVKIFDQICSLAHGPLLDLLEATIELTKYREFLEKQNRHDEESDVTANLDELLAEAHEMDQEDLEAGSTLERFLEFAALQSDTDRLNSENNVVTLMTLHAAKGLEFSHVYIAAVEENILPHSRSKDDPMSLEEERRLLFVGITRAKDSLQISCAKSRGFSGQGSGVPSSFLVELPRNELQIIDRTQLYEGEGYSGWSSSESQDWDDMCQLPESGHEEDRFEEGAIDYDSCQLPPDELQAHVANNLHGRNAVASELEVAGHAQSKFRVGAVVRHEEHGQGQITTSFGRGEKQSVTVQFLDGSQRSYRVSHANLQIVEE